MGADDIGQGVGGRLAHAKFAKSAKFSRPWSPPHFASVPTSRPVKGGRGSVRAAKGGQRAGRVSNRIDRIGRMGQEGGGKRTTKKGNKDMENGGDGNILNFCS